MATMTVSQLASTTTTGNIVSDTWSNIKAALSTTLTTKASNYTSITATDTGLLGLDLTSTLLSTYSSILAKLTNSNALDLTVTLATGVTAITAANIDTLQSLNTKLNTVVLPASTALSLTTTQLTNDAAVLAKVNSNFALTVTFPTGVTSITAGNIDSLQTLTKLTAVTLPTSSFSLSSSQLNSDAGVLAKITGTYTLTVSGVINATNIDTLQGLNAKLTSVSLTPASVLNLTATQLANDAEVLNKVSSTYTMNISDVVADNVITTLADTHVTKIFVKDTAANIVDNLSILQTNGAKIGSISLGASELNNAVTVAQATQIEKIKRHSTQFS